MPDSLKRSSSIWTFVAFKMSIAVDDICSVRNAVSGRQMRVSHRICLLRSSSCQRLFFPKYFLTSHYIYVFFQNNFWRTRVLFMGPMIPLFWTSGDVSSGFQSQNGQPYSHLAEVYVMYTYTSCQNAESSGWTISDSFDSRFASFQNFRLQFTAVVFQVTNQPTWVVFLSL